MSACREAQAYKQCKHCDKPLKFFCTVCQYGICENCVSGHLNSYPLKIHNVLPYRYKNTQRLAVPRCAFDKHPSELFCKTCDVHVCGESRGNHIDHDAIPTAKIICDHIESISSQNELLSQNIRPDHHNQLKSIQENVDSQERRFKEIEDKIHRHTQEWHSVVNRTEKKLISDLQEMRRQTLRYNKRHMNRIYRNLDQIDKIVEENNITLKDPEKLQSLDPSIIQDIAKVKDIPVSKDIIPLPIFFPGSIDANFRDVFGHVDDLSEMQTTKSPFLDNPLIEKTISYDKKISDISCYMSNAAWICGPETNDIARIFINGKILQKATLAFPPEYLTVTDGGVLYTDNISNTVNKISVHGTETIIATSEWVARGLLFTFGHVLVCQTNKRINHGRIGRYNAKGDLKDVIEYHNGIPLYGAPLSLTQNINDYIWTVDIQNSIVVVVDRNGALKFQYNGLPIKNANPFTPWGICNNSLGHVFISSHRESRIHILDKNGYLIRFLFPPGGIERPQDMSMDDSDRIWIVNFQGEIKVVKYLLDT